MPEVEPRSTWQLKTIVHSALRLWYVCVCVCVCVSLPSLSPPSFSSAFLPSSHLFTFAFTHLLTLSLSLSQLESPGFTRCPNEACNYGYHPIHVAARNASIGVLEAMLNFADSRGCLREKMITIPDLDGNVPLHLAVHGGEIKVRKVCVDVHVFDFCKFDIFLLFFCFT